MREGEIVVNPCLNACTLRLEGPNPLDVAVIHLLVQQLVLGLLQPHLDSPDSAKLSRSQVLSPQKLDLLPTKQRISTGIGTADCEKEIPTSYSTESEAGVTDGDWTGPQQR